MYIVLYTLLDLCVPIEDYGASRRQDWGSSPRDDRDWGGWRRDEKGPENAFTLDEIDDVAVICDIAEGNKCSRSWKILPEVGTDNEYPDLSLRDAEVMREINDKGN